MPTTTHAAALAFLWISVSLPAEEAAPPIAARGTWVLDARGEPTPPREISRGYQPSGLLFRKGDLWSIGDQRSAFPGHLLRIDPATGRLRGEPIRLDIAASAGPDLEVYRSIPNSDFEAICLDPGDPDRILAITEDKVPWIADIRLRDDAAAGGPTASIVRLVRLRFPDGLGSWRDDPNFRFEGICVSDDSRAAYLAFERAQDDLPRIYVVSPKALEADSVPELSLVPVRFDAVPPRADKPRALLNVNDIQFVRSAGRPLLLGVLRDQERIAVIDLARNEVVRVVDLDLRTPAGDAIEWVSPEGIAVDAATDRLWLINDPDSMRGNYRRRSTPSAEGPFAEFTPLVFEIRLSDVLGRK